MAVTSGFKSALSALAIGTAMLALPGAALAQEDHRHEGGGGNGAPHQEAARPAPAPAPAAAPNRAPPAAAPAARGENMRGANPWGGQGRPGQVLAPENRPAGNAGQPRPPANFVPGQQQNQGQQRGDAARGVQGRNEGNRNDGGQWRGGARPNDGGPVRNDGGQWRGNDGAGHGPDRNDRGEWRGGPGRNDGGRGGPGYGQAWNGNQWNHGWRQDNRYDWRGWRNQNRDAYRVGRYYPPYRDYSYNRLGIGIYLQPLFFGSDYWITDTGYYHLPPAYGPYHWVRYYNDAVLVNTYNGQVADVIYDFFW